MYQMLWAGRWGRGCKGRICERSHDLGMTEVLANRVRRRKLFYVPGYDPFPPRRYRELYRTEAARQAQISGHRIQIGPASDKGSYGWTVSAVIEGQAVETRVEVLVWSDIVRQSMGQGIVATYLQLFRTIWVYVASGALFRLMGLRKGPMIAALYPIILLLAELGVALVCGYGAGRLLGLHGAPVAVLSLAMTWAILVVFKRLDRSVYAWYLMHDYAFTAQAGGAYPEALNERLHTFAGAVAADLSADWDEVLVVGHSSGAHLAISMLALMIRSGAVKAGVTLSFLTLGQVVPMVSFLPKANGLRSDLAYLSTRHEVAWVDVTAPGDGCAFALCDPVAVSGQAQAGKRWPLVLSAAFRRTLSPERWQHLKRRYFRLHFQYLCAFDNLNGRRDEFDYFAISAGPLTLWERLGARAPSKNRITAAKNKYGIGA